MRTTKSMKRQQGAVAIIVGMAMLALLIVAALAIDIGNLAVARNETQNAADATALAAAECLYRHTACSNTTATQPDWSGAQAEASTFAPSNTIQGAAVQAVAASSGYWDVASPSTGLQSQSITPTSTDLPAVQVVVAKDGSDANGSVPAYLSRVIGFGFLRTRAVATAVVSWPGSVGPGGLFPFALSKCLYTAYWNSTTHSPALATSTAPLPGQTATQTIGQPYVFQVGSSYHINNCEAGQWTTFDTDKQSSSYMVGLMTTGNPNSMSIGQNTFLQSGTESNGYHAVASCSQAGDGSCAWETVAVVDTVTTTQGTPQPIVAFACVHILSESGSGKNATIYLQMANNPDKCQAGNSGGVGPNYGAITPPRLVQ